MRDDLDSIIIWFAIFSLVMGIALWADMANFRDGARKRDDDDDYDYYNHKEEE